MKKIGNKSFWIGFVFGILFTFAGLYIAFWFDSKRNEIVDFDEVKDVDALVFDDIYMGMTEDEFQMEMKKGVQGDYTLDQVDSILLDLALFNHGVPDSIIKIWRSLSDKKRLDAILGVATEDIKLWKRKSTPATTNNDSGKSCPNCKSTNVGMFLYGRYYPDSATVEAIRNNRLIPAGCTLNSKSPRYRCNSCSYEWGVMFKKRDIRVAVGTNKNTDLKCFPPQ